MKYKGTVYKRWHFYHVDNKCYYYAKHYYICSSTQTLSISDLSKIPTVSATCGQLSSSAHSENIYNPPSMYNGSVVTLFDTWQKLTRF